MFCFVSLVTSFARILLGLMAFFGVSRRSLLLDSDPTTLEIESEDSGENRACDEADGMGDGTGEGTDEGVGEGAGGGTVAEGQRTDACDRIGGGDVNKGANIDGSSDDAEADPN